MHTSLIGTAASCCLFFFFFFILPLLLLFVCISFERQRTRGTENLCMIGAVASCYNTSIAFLVCNFLLFSSNLSRSFWFRVWKVIPFLCFNVTFSYLLLLLLFSCDKAYQCWDRTISHCLLTQFKIWMDFFCSD